MSSPAGTGSQTAPADQTGDAQAADNHLPKTASPLPLVGALGVGMLSLGTLLRKRFAKG
jgi:LPXTG-motif cell wall-anchored protein